MGETAPASLLTAPGGTNHPGHRNRLWQNGLTGPVLLGSFSRSLGNYENPERFPHSVATAQLSGLFNSISLDVAFTYLQDLFPAILRSWNLRKEGKGYAKFCKAIHLFSNMCQCLLQHKRRKKLEYKLK